MKKVFLDSSALLAAVGSKSGASARILAHCRRKIIEGYISKYVLIELKRNLEKKFDEKHKQRFHGLLLKSNILVIEDVHHDLRIKYQDVISAKDTPILATAHFLKVDYLITHNTKDFMKQVVYERVFPTEIITPSKFVHIIEKRLAG